jgi:hypothetical protein
MVFVVALSVGCTSVPTNLFPGAGGSGGSQSFLMAVATSGTGVSPSFATVGVGTSAAAMGATTGQGTVDNSGPQ